MNSRLSFRRSAAMQLGVNPLDVKPSSSVHPTCSWNAWASLGPANTIKASAAPNPVRSAVTTPTVGSPSSPSFQNVMIVGQRIFTVFNSFLSSLPYTSFWVRGLAVVGGPLALVAGMGYQEGQDSNTKTMGATKTPAAMMARITTGPRERGRKARITACPRRTLGVRKASNPEELAAKLEADLETLGGRRP